MRYREDASLDTSNVQDRRRGGGRAVALGGGGIGVVGVIVVILFQLLGGSGGGGGSTDPGQVLGPVLDGLGQGETADDGELKQSCRTGEDANEKTECAVVADIESIQDYWTTELPKLGTRYRSTDTVFFSGQTSTGCGTADSGTGPFYCPSDGLVYIDLSFFDELRTRFGAEGGAFPNAYVLAHEYGHRVQDLLGTSDRVGRATGPTSGSVRLELQADCYAGAWAKHASSTPDDGSDPLISEISQDDVAAALDTASRIGDDYIQQQLGGGQVDEGSFTHGSSEQRERWFSTGYRTGDPARCDTFAAEDLG